MHIQHLGPNVEARERVGGLEEFAPLEGDESGSGFEESGDEWSIRTVSKSSEFIAKSTDMVMEDP